MARAFVSHFVVLTVVVVVFFFMKTYHRCLIPFSNFAIVLVSWKQNFVSSNLSVIILVIDKIGLPLHGRPIFFNDLYH